MEDKNTPWDINKKSKVFQVWENNNIKILSSEIKDAVIQISMEIGSPYQDITHGIWCDYEERKYPHETYKMFVERSWIVQEGDFLVSTEWTEKQKDEDIIVEEIIIVSIENLRTAVDKQISRKEEEINQLQRFKK